MNRNLLILCLALLIAFFQEAHSQDFRWAGHLGGTSNDYGLCSAVDDSGNVFVAGYFSGTADFDPGPATYNLTSAGATDVYFCKLSPEGNFVWAKRFGGALDDHGDWITLDDSGNVYTTGYFEGTVDFDPGAGTFNLTSSGAEEIFVSKLSASGDFVWAQQMGGTGADYGASLIIDSQGAVCATGRFSGVADFDPGAGVVNLTAAGGDDIFICKLTASGSLAWAKRVGGSSDESGTDIATDAGNSVYSTGYFRGTADFDPGPGTYNLSSALAGSDDIFISKLDSAGTFVWAKRIGSNATDRGYSLDIDPLGNLLVTGYFRGIVDFDPGVGTFTMSSSAGWEDVFVLKLDTLGNFSYSLRFGDINTDVGRRLTIDDTGNIYITGHFKGGVDFDPGPGVFTIGSTSSTDDAYVSKLDPSGNFRWAKRFGGMFDDYGRSVSIGPGGNVHTIGYFIGTVDFDPGPSNYPITSFGNSDAFVQKMGQCIRTISTLTVSSCDSYTSPSGNGTWTSSGIYHDTLTNPSGCYSLFTIDLTILRSTSATQSASACGSYFWPATGLTYNTSGTYTRVIPNAAGCDSTLTLNLSIFTHSYATLNPSACNSYTSPGGHIWTLSGAYSDTLPNAAGCDSILTINLSIRQSSTGTQNTTACEYYSWPTSGQVFSASGTYTHVLLNAAGCDSTATLNLTILPNSFASLNPSACNTYTSPGGQIWTLSGTYSDTLPNAAGCDSILTINLSIITVDTSVNQANATLTSNSANSTWKWLDCNNNFAPVPGATTQSFSPAQSGVYAVEVIKNGCTDTSACRAVTLVSTEGATNAPSILIFPNPTTGILTLYTGNDYDQISIEIRNPFGQLISEQNFHGGEAISFELRGPKGIYFLQISSPDGPIANFRVLKE